MTSAAVLVALVAAAVNLGAAAIGGWAYYRVRQSRLFWILARGAQASALALALLTGVLVASGRHPRDDLFYLYAMVPLAVGLAAEQLRIAAAETVLGARGLADAQAVGALPEADQHSIVMSILRREMGVMALAAVVVCVLELRAAGTAHGF